MFNDLSGEKNPNDSSASGVDDIFAETDNTSGANNSPQINTQQAGLSSVNQTIGDQNPSTESMPQVEESNSGGGKMLKIAIFAVLGAIVILGGYLAYTTFLAPDTENDVEVPIVVDNDVDSDESEVDVTPPIVEQNNDNFVTPIVDRDPVPVVDDVIVSDDPVDIGEGDPMRDKVISYYGRYIPADELRMMDSDGDGLSDYDEIYLWGTDPFNVDTDNDGLSDYDEVMIWGTDPLNPDTDGDGYLDGEEVEHGYNPLDPAPGARLPGF